MRAFGSKPVSAESNEIWPVWDALKAVMLSYSDFSRAKELEGNVARRGPRISLPAAS